MVASNINGTIEDGGAGIDDGGINGIIDDVRIDGIIDNGGGIDNGEHRWYYQCYHRRPWSVVASMVACFHQT